jgi:hypothetical protein
VYLIVLGVALLAAILWSWSFASSLISANSGITVALYLFGVKFFPSAGFSLLLIVLLTAMTLKSGYMRWLTEANQCGRTGPAGVHGGHGRFFNAATTKDQPALVIAAAIGDWQVSSPTRP